MNGNSPKAGTITRRKWLSKGIIYSAVGTASAVLGGIIFDVLLAAGRFSSARWVEVAAVSSIPPDVTVPFPDRKIAIIRRGGHLAAISLECTHLGCLLNSTGQGFYCPCHGSIFGPFGEVYSGPAPTPLKWHNVRLRKDRIWVHSGTRNPKPLWIAVT